LYHNSEFAKTWLYFQVLANLVISLNFPKLVGFGKFWKIEEVKYGKRAQVF
jgi:hypothetical protein